MYYLEDKHPKFEYCVYVQVKGGQPYLTWHGDNIGDVQRYIKEIEKRHGRYKQHFFIDNDFYVNEYHKNDYVYYYRFMKRKVNDWQVLKSEANSDIRKVA